MAGVPPFCVIHKKAPFVIIWPPRAHMLLCACRDAEKFVASAPPAAPSYNDAWVGLARTIYIRCIYGTFGREITKYTVIYGVYIQFWPTLCMSFGPFHTVCTRMQPLCNAILLGLARTIYIRCRVVQFEVRPKVWVRKLSRILTNLKSVVRSSSNFTACLCQSCKGQQTPPVQSHSFLAVKVTCSMIYIWIMKYDL